MTLCLFKAITGVPCPGCGMMRAHLALARGDARRALHWHPLFWLPWVALGTYAATRRGRLRRAADTGALRLLGWASLAVHLGVWIARLRFRIPGVASQRW